MNVLEKRKNGQAKILRKTNKFTIIVSNFVREQLINGRVIFQGVGIERQRSNSIQIH